MNRFRTTTQPLFRLLNESGYIGEIDPVLSRPKPRHVAEPRPDQNVRIAVSSRTRYTSGDAIPLGDARLHAASPIGHACDCAPD